MPITVSGTTANLLTIVKDATQRMGLSIPTAVASSADPQILQFMGLLNEEGKELTQRTNWAALDFEATFTTTAVELQGVLSTIAPGLKFIINDTIYNRTLRRPVFGPLGAQIWQQRKAMFLTGPWNQFRVRNGQVLFNPAPTVGQDCFFEYSGTTWVTDVGGTVYSDGFQADTDVPLLDKDILTLGLIWRWKRAKGIKFTADQQQHELAIINAIGRDGSKPILSMGAGYDDVLPGVFVPAGSWGV